MSAFPNLDVTPANLQLSFTYSQSLNQINGVSLSAAPLNSNQTTKADLTNLASGVLTVDNNADFDAPYYGSSTIGMTGLTGNTSGCNANLSATNIGGAIIPMIQSGVLSGRCTLQGQDTIPNILILAQGQWRVTMVP